MNTFTRTRVALKNFKAKQLKCKWNTLLLNNKGSLQCVGGKCQNNVFSTNVELLKIKGIA